MVDETNIPQSQSSDYDGYGPKPAADLVSGVPGARVGGGFNYDHPLAHPAPMHHESNPAVYRDSSTTWTVCPDCGARVPFGQEHEKGHAAL
jgi:hypothetical protein